MNKRKHKPQWLTLLIFIAALLGIALYLNANPDLIELLGNILWWQAILLIVLRLLFLGLNGYFLKIFARLFNVKLAVWEWFGLAFVTTMGNYLTPFSGGMLVRATYLKVRHAFPYAQFISLLAASYLLTFWVAGVLGLVAVLQLGAVTGGETLLLIFFAVLVTAVTLIFFLPTFKLPSQWRIIKIVNEMLVGWGKIRTNSGLLLRLGSINLVSMLLNGLAFWLAFHALDISVSFPKALLISLSAVFSVVLTITPGNLGIREAIIGLTGELIGIGVGEGLIVALLIRASTLVSAFTLGPLFSYRLTRELQKMDTSLAEDHSL